MSASVSTAASSGTACRSNAQVAIDLRRCKAHVGGNRIYAHALLVHGGNLRRSGELY
jgi:hypothetical protein